MHPCARCALTQRTCCQRAEILVTRADVARIQAATGQRDFWERRAPSDPEYAQPDPRDPRWLELTFAADGTRALLRRGSSGDCHFLGPAGCRLALEVRPLVCRLYPHGYHAQGLLGLDDEYCPRELLAAPGQTMAEVLDVRRDDAESWRAALYAELDQDGAAASGTPRQAAAATACSHTGDSRC